MTRASLVDVQHFICTRLDKKGSTILDADTFYMPLQAPVYYLKDSGELMALEAAHQQANNNNRSPQRATKGGLTTQKMAKRNGNMSPRSQNHAGGLRNVGSPFSAVSAGSAGISGDAVTDLIRNGKKRLPLSKDQKVAVLQCPISQCRLWQFPTACTEWAYYDNVKRVEMKIPDDLREARRVHLSMWARCTDPTVDKTVQSVQWRFRFVRDLRALVAPNSSTMAAPPLKHQLQYLRFTEDDLTLILLYGDLSDIVCDVSRRDKLEKTLWVLQQEVQREVGEASFFMTHFASGYAVIKLSSAKARNCALKRIMTARFIRTAEYPPIAVFIPIVFTLLASARDYRKLQKVVATQSAGLTGHHFEDIIRDDVDEGLHRDATMVQSAYRGFRTRKFLRCVKDMLEREASTRSWHRQSAHNTFKLIKQSMNVEQQELLILAEGESRFDILDIEGKFAAEHVQRRIVVHVGAEAIGRSDIAKQDQRIRLSFAEMSPRAALWFQQTTQFDFLLAVHRTWFRAIWSWYYVLLEEFQEALAIKDHMRQSALQIYAVNEVSGAGGGRRTGRLALLNPRNLDVPPCSFDFACSLNVVPIGATSTKRRQLQDLMTLSTSL